MKTDKLTRPFKNKHGSWSRTYFLILLIFFARCALGYIDPADLEYNYNATGSVDRCVFDKAMEIVSVKDFGAVGDGSNDDTTEIQNAINYVESQGGGHVKFPVGEYKISSQLTIDDAGVVLIGEGSTQSGSTDEASVILNSSTTANAVSITGDYSGVDNLTIRSSGKPTNGYAVYIDNCEGSFVTRTLIEDAYYGIMVYRSDFASVQDVILKDIRSHYGIRLLGTSSTSCNNPFIRTVTGLAASSNNTTIWLALGDYVKYAQIHRLSTSEGLRGIAIHGTSASAGPKRTQVSAFKCKSPYKEGIQVGYAKTIHLYDININGSDIYPGIGVAGFFSGGLQISNINITGCYKEGIRLDGSDNIYINNPMIGNNSLKGTDQCSGININADTDNVTITGGTIGQLYGQTNKQNYGVYITDHSHENINVHGVNLAGNVSGGLLDLDSTSSWVRDNPGSYNKPDGVIPFKISGTVNSGDYFCQRIYGRKIRILGFTAKLGSGTCGIRVSESGTNQTGGVSLNTTRKDFTYSVPADIDATGSGKRIEVDVYSPSGAANLEGAFYYVNIH